MTTSCAAPPATHRLTLAAVLALAAAATTTAATLVGDWQGSGHRVSFGAQGALSYDGEPMRYQVIGPGDLVYQSAEGLGRARFRFEGEALILTGAEIGTLRLTRAGAPARPSAPSPRPAAPRPPAPPAQPAGDFLAAELGFRMTPAPGWRWHLGEEAVVFGHAKVAGLVLAFLAGETLSEADVRRVAQAGYRDEGADLKPRKPGSLTPVATGQGAGFIFEIGGTLAPPRGPRGESLGGARLDRPSDPAAAASTPAKPPTPPGPVPVQGLAGLYLVPGGESVVVLAVASPEKAPALLAHVRPMLTSVRLTRPTNPSVRQWDQDLRGHKVEYMWSYSSGSSPSGAHAGGSQNKEWHLCRDGQYWYRGRSHLSADGGSGGGIVSGYSHKGATEAGRWEIRPQGQGAAIVFHPQGAQAYSYALSKKRKFATSFYQTRFGDMGVYAPDWADCR